MKIMTILGTRPEIIRLSRILPALDASTRHVLVHTGQNYDPALSGNFFRELGLREPDHDLGAGEGSLGDRLAVTLSGAEAVMLLERPDAVLILGDTNSSLAGIMARRLRIPLFHMEAGNRCFDENVPEEINRRIIDHIADINITYTEHARRNLLAEGLHPRSIYVCGSPMYEVLQHYRQGYEQSQVLAQLGLVRGQYFAVSLHREESVDHPEHLQLLLEALRRLRERYRDRELIVSTHPRTRQRLDDLGISGMEGTRFFSPFGFFDYLRLQMDAACVLSDSGTLSEESAILGFPAVTLRRSMERPEAMDAGTITLTGFSPEAILASVAHAMDRYAGGTGHAVPEAYQVPDTSARVMRIILGTAGLIRTWKGIDMPAPAPGDR